MPIHRLYNYGLPLAGATRQIGAQHRVTAQSAAPNPTYGAEALSLDVLVFPQRIQQFLCLYLEIAHFLNILRE